MTYTKIEDGNEDVGVFVGIAKVCNAEGLKDGRLVVGGKEEEPDEGD